MGKINEGIFWRNAYQEEQSTPESDTRPVYIPFHELIECIDDLLHLPQLKHKQSLEAVQRGMAILHAVKDRR